MRRRNGAEPDQIVTGWRGMRRSIRRILAGYALLLLGTFSAQAQIQVDIKLPRLQYIAYEPVVATVGITNLAGRDIELRDNDEQAWFGFEVSGSEGQPIA